MKVPVASFRAARRAALEKCSECGAPALPYCLVCTSPAIVREKEATRCFDCGTDTYCPCGVLDEDDGVEWPPHDFDGEVCA